MVKLSLCPKCNKKGFYYRVAFGSWRCARYGYEEEAKVKDKIKLYSYYKSGGLENE